MSASLFGDLPACPNVASVTAVLAYPSLFVTFSVTAVASFLFVLMVAFKYNNISKEVARDQYFEAVTLTLHGLSTLALSMALNHQRRFRSSGAVQMEDSETDPLLKRYDRLKRVLSPLDLLFMLVAATYVALVWPAVLMRLEHVWLKWAFLSVFLIQRVPPLLLAVMIIFFPKAPERGAVNGTVADGHQAPEGPSRKAKALLGLGTLFSVSGYVPLSLWTRATGTECVFWVASVVDLLHIFYVTGLILYFAFLRSEYLRNMEECIWGAVQSFQRNAFDFKKF